MSALTILKKVVSFATKGLEASYEKKHTPNEMMAMITDLGNLSINDVEKLHRMGVEFSVHDRKVLGIKIIFKGAV